MSSLLNYLFKNFFLKEKNVFANYSIVRRYSKITSVNTNNWNSIHKEIISKIHDSDFVSIDVEYTGLHLKDERYISIDSSYEAHCYGAKSFFPCQIGITIAKKRNITRNKEWKEGTEEGYKKGSCKKEGCEQNRNIHGMRVLRNSEEMKRIDPLENYQQWDISPYCIYVFPKENKYFSVSTTTLIFLKENNFDFNEWIFNGVGYLRPSEEEEKKKNIFEKIDELKNLLSKCNTKTCNKEENENYKKIDINKIIHEIENYKIVDDDDKEAVIQIIKKIGVWLNRGNKYHRADYSSENDENKGMFESNAAFKNVKYGNESPSGEGTRSRFKTAFTESDNHGKGQHGRGDDNYDPIKIGEKENIIEKSVSRDFLGNTQHKNYTRDHDRYSGSDLFHMNLGSDGEVPLCDKELIRKIDKSGNPWNDPNNLEDIPDDCPLYIEIENPYLRLLAHTLITKYFNFIFCISVKVNDKKHLAIYKTEKDSYKAQIRCFELEIEKINETIGVRLLFDEIIKNKKIITGHNCFYDMLHIYQTFYHDLPNSISVFKKKWTELFPYTFDTKYMNETNEYLYALNGPATLKGLCEYMASLISSSKDFDFLLNFMNGHLDLPQCLVPFVNTTDESSTSGENREAVCSTGVYGLLGDDIGNRMKNGENCRDNAERVEETSEDNQHARILRDNPADNANVLKSDEHNAGYDSLLTCLLFIFQCHHILKKNNMLWKDVYFNRENNKNENAKCFFNIFSSMCNRIKIVKTQPNVVSLTSTENSEMARHFYMYDYPSYFKKWEIMKIWSPIWISLSKVDDQSCWIIAKSDDDAKNIKMIYKMLQNPQFKLCTYEEYLCKFKMS
ncbi:poly(A)-specific ribonuclease PARN, putative [Plasmodium ovale]|uniref:Poly(A)-specific ribonuclease PARN, putative n=1 Tax=Plasmodium ovale TaxID=36330 RepID=A0A1C3KWD8_PLAOA|nr:poly(A)-specific ribonuclease PARN, putative [Plasmodium ovale]